MVRCTRLSLADGVGAEYKLVSESLTVEECKAECLEDEHCVAVAYACFVWKGQNFIRQSAGLWAGGCAWRSTE